MFSEAVWDSIYGVLYRGLLTIIRSSPLILILAYLFIFCFLAQRLSLIPLTFIL